MRRREGESQDGKRARAVLLPPPPPHHRHCHRPHCAARVMRCIEPVRCAECGGVGDAPPPRPTL